MLFKKFMEEVAAIEAAGEFKDPVSKEVAKEEEIIGSIADNPYLMALFMAGQNRARAYKDRIPQMTKDRAQTERVEEEFGAIREMIWTEIRLHLSVFGGHVELRKGWTVVRTKEKQPMPRPRTLELVISLSTLGGFGDPDYPAQGIGRGRGNADPDYPIFR